ncbi:prolyl-tRNA synthetase associated domain-containing protein [Selenomonas sp. TAMA-11512]|uniref:prolyl-tRNA synthetase associated domain-containing protein n=1 Tax=Selenomonas sp. TAMA-11512 TaxID=3095337 RepID=UPI0030938E4F|nr:prolyl-tRNA synthetase associated domain-containing protein [Selenomonas sp. TAMA-11512]
MDILKLLDELHIPYEKTEHEPVYTVAESRELHIADTLEGSPCKNLFLKSKKGEFFLLVLPAEKRADLKQVAASLGLPRLSFASEQELLDILSLHPGSVTPLSLVNDTEKKVTLILDGSLEGGRLLLHPNTNTATVSLAFADLLQFIRYVDHSCLMLM